jgi:hypothetical protein
MKHTFKVHSAHVTPHNVKAKLADGTEVDAPVDAFEVQLVPDNAHSGTIKLHICGKDMDGAKALFVPGKKIAVSFEEA